MKIRNGFISNSSSSSFIIGLVKPINEYVDYNTFAKDHEIQPMDSEFGKRLYEDLKEYKMKIDEDSVYVEIYEKTNLTDDEQDDIIKQTEQYMIKLIQDKINEKAKNAQYVLEYADDDGRFYSIMEHEFMPKFKGTIEIKSHH